MRQQSSFTVREFLPSQANAWFPYPFVLLGEEEKYIWIANCGDCRQKGNACNGPLLKIRLLLQHRWAPPWIYRYAAQLHIFPSRGRPETLNSDGIDEPGGQDWNILADRPSANWGMDKKDCQVNKEDVSCLLCPSVICVRAQLHSKSLSQLTLQLPKLCASGRIRQRVFVRQICFCILVLMLLSGRRVWSSENVWLLKCSSRGLFGRWATHFICKSAPFHFGSTTTLIAATFGY